MKMTLQSCSRAFSIVAASPPPYVTPAVKLHRRLLLLLSPSSATVGCSFSSKTGCALSLPLFRSNFVNKSTVRGIHSTRMEAASSTVPSIVVYVTVPNKEAGKKLAESIVKERLAACVNIVPGIESVYWWDGKVQTDSEELLIIKTRESLLESLTEHVKSNHEYDVPEVIALPIKGGNSKYLEWIKNSTKD
ncbi:hypothetical protein QJS10_CPB19g01536 [Acorus calamus]|uniref:Protein CutA, chloroplastic n=1 Tax=Acorus calamus TaxID=4465 RepID=A0AAV9CJ72_ACOCL|nr:hypothetical protein QJS10_CPB19g01536 [Acorus calamus]